MAPAKLQNSYTLFGSAPWGFRLSGGREFNQALVICRVTPGSVASRCGLESGDVMISVEGQFCQDMTQEVCENLVKNARGSLNLVVEKPADPSLNVDRSVYAPNNADVVGPHVPSQVVDVPVFDPSAMKKSANKKMMLMQGPGQSKVVHAQYNTPLDMYSNSNIVDSVQAQACSMGVSMPDAAQAYGGGNNINPNSAVFREVHRRGNNGPKNRQSRSFNMLQNIIGEH